MQTLGKRFFLKKETKTLKNGSVLRIELIIIKSLPKEICNNFNYLK